MIPKCGYWFSESSSNYEPSAALHLEVAALLHGVVPRAAGTGENGAGEDREGRDGGEHELGHGSCSFRGWVGGLGSAHVRHLASQVRLSTCEARVARRCGNAGERRHTPVIFFIGDDPVPR